MRDCFDLCLGLGLYRALEVWNNRVKQHTTHAAHRHRLGLAFAGAAFLWIVVHAAIVTLNMPLEPDLTILAPIFSPTVLDDPKWLAVLFAVAQSNDSMVHHGIFGATVEDATFIPEPLVT